MSMHRLAFLTLVLAATTLAVPADVLAQQDRSAARKTAKAVPAKKDAEPSSGDPALRARVEQLEEQLTDMQVVIGTLESLGRSSPSGASPRPGPAGGVDQARVDSLETQIRAIAGQLEQLSGQVRQLSTGARRSDIGPVGDPRNTTLAAVPRPQPQAGVAEPQPAPAAQGFGATTVVPSSGSNGDPIGRLIAPETPQNASAKAAPALSAAASSAASPRELYETAYGYLLQQDYGSAEAAFDEFLRRYPQDRLAADAQYWLGETLYVQRRFKPAGQAFLAVVEKHKGSAKVPNSLLKLAQSLEQLGQKDCGIFTELESRYINAPADVRVKARTLKQRQGC